MATSGLLSLALVRLGTSHRQAQLPSSRFLHSTPNGITAGPDGNLWFTDSGANQIERITPGGIVMGFPIPTHNSGPMEITTGLDGNLRFTENTAGRIGRITPTGTITEFSLSLSENGPSGITAGPGGTIWFTAWGGNAPNNTDLIGRITTGK